MTVLKLDHDGARCPRLWRWRAQWLASRMGWTLLALSYSRSTGGGWHGEVVVRERLDACTVIAAQAILGSHWAREAYNLMRVHSPAFKNPLWRARANVLYTTYDRRHIDCR